jgi:hypothetical protein
MTEDKSVPVPSGLRAASRRWFAAVVEEFEPAPHEAALLETACRAYDRAEQLRHRVNREGLMVFDRFGKSRVNPALIEERNQRDLQRRAIASLTFAPEEPE